MVKGEFDIQEGVRAFQEVPPLLPEIISGLDFVSLPPLRIIPSQCGYVEIAGTTLAVGKTEATQVLGGFLTRSGLEVIVHPERWRENVFLGDPARCFHSELCFLRLKAEDNEKVKTYSSSGMVIGEVSPESDFLYTATDYVLGNITEDEFGCYQQLYRVLSSNMPKPDLIVFLDCSDDEIIKRMRQRVAQEEGREFEIAEEQKQRALALKYLSTRWLDEGGWGETPVLEVDSSGLDFTSKGDGRIAFAEMVVGELQKVNPAKFAGSRVTEFRSR